MKAFFKHFSFALLGAFAICASLGVLLVFFFSLSMRIMPAIMGAALIIYGFAGIIGYFRSQNRTVSSAFSFGISVMLIIIGIWICTGPAEIMSLILIFLALVLLFHGSVDMALSFRQKQLQYRFWYVTLIAAIVTIAAGVIVLVDPFENILVRIYILGGSLMLDGLLDLVLAFLMASLEKRAENAAAATETEGKYITDGEE